MQLTIIVLIGVLSACAMFLIMESSFARVLFGFIVLSNAANLFILAMSGSPEGKAAPIVVDYSGANSYVDPLPQALILTAIVIGFGVITYLIFMLYRVFLDYGTTNALDLYRKGHPMDGGDEE